ncbi:MAG: class I SAM-dependent methyltransferase [Dehalococcoidia bacterium]|nr:MAG: class I SAM-dependent methyltransferase [Dehalococcoidia bacterium]
MLSQEYSAPKSRAEAPPVNLEASPFEHLASDYDAWFDGEGKLIFAIEVQAFQEVLPFLSKPWLEVGVGSGRFAQTLGIETGVDPSIKLLNMARGRGIAVFLGRGEQEPLVAESFGTVFFIVTLCFVSSPLAVLREAYRILQPGGKVVLGLVLAESPWGRFYESKKKQGHSFYQRATFYRYDEAVGLLGQAGFTVEKVMATLFQKPSEVGYMELPREGFSPDAGFTVIMAGKGAT